MDSFTNTLIIAGHFLEVNSWGGTMEVMQQKDSNHFPNAVCWNSLEYATEIDRNFDLHLIVFIQCSSWVFHSRFFLTR